MPRFQTREAPLLKHSGLYHFGHCAEKYWNDDELELCYWYWRVAGCGLACIGSESKRISVTIDMRGFEN